MRLPWREGAMMSANKSAGHRANCFCRLLRNAAALLCAAFIGVALLASAAYADTQEGRRVALVIGNGAYANAPRLENPAADARAVALNFGSSVSR